MRTAFWKQAAIQLWTVSFFIHKIKEREEFYMKEFWNTIQLIFVATGGWLGWFLGGCDGLLYALLAFVAVDYITGVVPLGTKNCPVKSGLRASAERY